MHGKMWGVLFLLVIGLAMWAPQPGAAQEKLSVQRVAGVLESFAALDARTAWVLTGDALLLTEDGGETWHTMTPPPLQTHAHRAAAFIDAQTGWTAHAFPDDPGVVVFAATSDGGRHWHVERRRLLDAHDPAAFIDQLSLFWLDRSHGWLMLRQRTSSNFDLGALFRTQDGGLSWQRVDAPGGQPVRFTTPLTGWTVGGPNGSALYRTDDGGISWRVQLLPCSEDAAGALPRHTLPHFRAGGRHGVVGVFINHEEGQRQEWCATEDGGATWTRLDVAPPAMEIDFGWRLDAAANALLRTPDQGHTWRAVLAGEERPTITAAAVTRAANTRTARLTGHGFDMCELTGEENLRRWIEASPYRAVNLYIGGALRACRNRLLDAELLEWLTRQGWTFIPTWVGPQAPCTNFREKFDFNPVIAFSQGRAEAEKAIESARRLGLTEADGSGTVIYYDLEAYNGQDPACVEAARAFVAGWVQRLHESNNQAGLYAHACSPPIAEYATLPTPPDAVWFAAWNRPSFDPNVTVWDISPNCLPPTLWTRQQRIYQYTGGHPETWGGVTLPIDSNALDGIVADLRGVVQPKTSVIVREPELSPRFEERTACEDGWHRFTNVRGYPTYLAASQPLGQTIPPLNYGIWRPALPVTGVYRVEALIASHGKVEWPCRDETLQPDTSQARYIVHHYGGATTTVHDQLPLNDVWLRLGSYPFVAGEEGFVYLDAAVADHPRLVSFSAMRFILEIEGLFTETVYLPLIAR
ncbi:MULTISPECIES: glycoside hydrolase domain-containing protein [Caldilinea]|nr:MULTISPECIES: glycoside hydrolase domain-containing protein [Caldilinea]GIV73249.1 MAG: hypothetical protein KatS3mg049_1805 [Caldilinea sp.]